MQPNHTYSFENVTFAELEGRTVGMVLAFTAEQHRAFSDRPLKDAAGRQQRRIRVVQALFSPMMQILNSIADGDLYVLSVAVDEDTRGQGVGTVLLDGVERLAVERGAKRLSLDVGSSNKGALRLYERRGMEVESRWPKRIPLPGLTMLRMSKPL
jgi:ribosomal protein S18 acetylase RimI-like enzyme